MLSLADPRASLGSRICTLSCSFLCGGRMCGLSGVVSAPSTGNPGLSGVGLMMFLCTPGAVVFANGLPGLFLAAILNLFNISSLSSFSCL